ncbi:hypothetical protein [Paenibacillus pini]|uniref:Uncharacterized protein n=1 Tax=Paenibacillus pini JCM 16418 TaxID=1236976 RepID=W7YAG4_9BACL|nr:hypothetical protein [Paenibacillus pini]GAF08035.1 hypothetical protein JCM16418_2072 [Paenibacillus pini JCM 16418]
MALEPFEMRIMVNACITRYEIDEVPMNTIINSYNITKDDANLIRSEILERKGEIIFDVE